MSALTELAGGDRYPDPARPYPLTNDLAQGVYVALISAGRPGEYDGIAREFARGRAKRGKYGGFLEYGPEELEPLPAWILRRNKRRETDLIGALELEYVNYGPHTAPEILEILAAGPPSPEHPYTGERCESCQSATLAGRPCRRCAELAAEELEELEERARIAEERASSPDTEPF